MVSIVYFNYCKRCIASRKIAFCGHVSLKMPKLFSIFCNFFGVANFYKIRNSNLLYDTVLLYSSSPQ